MSSSRRLLFIVPDRLSRLVDKGEIPRRYYNPGDYFDEVHLLTATNDAPEARLLEDTVGSAELHIHRLWTRSDYLNVPLSPVLERNWARRAISLASEVRPNLVRTGDRLTGYLGARVKQSLGIPHIVSLHSHRDDQRRRMPWGPHRLLREYEKRYDHLAFAAADAVIIVYESLRECALAYGARRVELIYNVVCPGQADHKREYGVDGRARIASVGRLIEGKVPEQLILAMRDVDAELTLFGDGDAAARVRGLVKENELTDRVSFHRSMLNADLCRELIGYDLFAAYNDYPGIPKTIMEGLWLGLPTVINDRQTRPVPELSGDWLCRVQNNREGYAQGLDSLLSNEERRTSLGRRGRAFAEDTFAPEQMESRLVELYTEFVENAHNSG